MKNNRNAAACLLLCISLAGCDLFAGQEPPTPVMPPATSAAVAQPSPTAPALSIELLKNGTYRLPAHGKTVTLTDGKFDSGDDSERLTVRLEEPVAFGDLDGDGTDDAAILLSENSGGTGVYKSLIAILNRDGMPVQSAEEFLGDRPYIHEMVIRNGAVTIHATVHNGEDPLCCPSFSVARTYRLTGDAFRLAQQTSQTADGRERAILIQGAAASVQSGQAFRVSGIVTVSPFENTLVYRLLSIPGKVFAEGPFMVRSDGMGGPGTFDTTIEIPRFAEKITLIFEIFETSAVDGSILALDSLELSILP